jgi:hypothetical protein
MSLHSRIKGEELGSQRLSVNPLYALEGETMN